MSPGDLVTAAIILSVAGWILWRSLLRKKGGCHGCSGCSSQGGGSGVVKLGAPRGPRPGDTAKRGLAP
jgi:hypothetical protein